MGTGTTLGPLGDDPHTLENKNCKVCLGGDCRCPGPACDDEGLEAPRGVDGGPYVSFFRHYDVTTNRQRINEVPNDALSNIAAQVHCYDTYREYDAKVTESETPQCVVGNIVTRNGLYDAAQLEDTQNGYGQFRPDQSRDIPLTPRPEDPTQLWYTPILGAFSFLFPGKDITDGLLSPDLAIQRASVQKTEQDPWAVFGTIRSVDDTVTNDGGGTRPFTEWWQR